MTEQVSLECDSSRRSSGCAFMVHYKQTLQHLLPKCATVSENMPRTVYPLWCNLPTLGHAHRAGQGQEESTERYSHSI